jgi:undecaprenyl-diphosphatase
MTGRRSRGVAHLVTGAAVFLGCGHAARRGTVGALEERMFRAVNGLPPALFAPTWVVMQVGSLGGVVAVGAAAAAAGERRLARELLGAGCVTWTAAKVLKRFVRRGRPAATLSASRVLGRAQTGLGYPSGHAAVAVALASVARRRVTEPPAAVFWAAPLATGVARIYVGAHLPLDVVGGAALGGAISAAAGLMSGGPSGGDPGPTRFGDSSRPLSPQSRAAGPRSGRLRPSDGVGTGQRGLLRWR